MSYTIVIPTMWKRPDQLCAMLDRYSESDWISEILLIDNGGVDRSEVDPYTLVKVLNDGNNLFVNPSWNLGVANATCDKVILANDDITIPDLDWALLEIDVAINPGVLIGLDKNSFKQKRTGELGPVRVVKHEGGHEYGFGVFMAFYKESYIPIPEELKVWFGDSFLYKLLDPYVLTGIDVQTDMRSTSRTMNLKKQHKLEKEFFLNLQL